MNKLTDLLNRISDSSNFYTLRQDLWRLGWSIEKNDKGQSVLAHPFHDPIMEDDLKDIFFSKKYAKEIDSLAREFYVKTGMSAKECIDKAKEFYIAKGL